MQFAAAIEEGKGVLFGTVMAMAPIAAITLWVVEVRRMFRLQGRAAGTVAQPAATIEPALWLRFFKQAWTAKKFALIDRCLGADDAMKLGILHAQPKPKALVAPVPPRSRHRRRGRPAAAALPHRQPHRGRPPGRRANEQSTATGGFASVDFPATETSSPNGHHGYDLNGSAPYGLR